MVCGEKGQVRAGRGTVEEECGESAGDVTNILGLCVLDHRADSLLR